MAGICKSKVGTWQRRFHHGMLKAVFALPVAAVLIAGAHQPGESQALSLEGERDGASQSDSLRLVNRTDTAFVYLAFHPKTARPQPAEVEVNLDDPPSEFVAAGGETGLWSCDSLDAYENYTLHLYRIPADETEGVVMAPLARSTVLTTERLEAARRRSCQFEIGEL